MVIQTDLDVRSFGLQVSPEKPWYGASPDNLTCCSCCKYGCLEVKCLVIEREITKGRGSKRGMLCYLWLKKWDLQTRQGSSVLFPSSVGNIYLKSWILLFYGLDTHGIFWLFILIEMMNSLMICLINVTYFGLI